MKNNTKKMIKRALTIVLVLSLSMTLAIPAYAGQWIIDHSQNRWWYQRDDGSYPAGQWEQIGGIWYYFWSDGYMASNCEIPDGSGSWVDENGAWILTTQQANPELRGSWHLDMYHGYWYQRADGSYPAGQWEQIGDIWYYFWNDGYMAQNCWTPDGEFVDKNGAWVVGSKATNNYSTNNYSGYGYSGYGYSGYDDSGYDYSGYDYSGYDYSDYDDSDHDDSDYDYPDYYDSGYDDSGNDDSGNDDYEEGEPMG